MKVATRIFLYIICATLLFSCISNNSPGLLARRLDIDGVTYTNKVIIGTQFTKEQILVAQQGLVNVIRITDMNYDVDFSYYFWATNLPSEFHAITINMDKSKPFRLILVNPDVYPINTNNYVGVTLFGCTVAHEWLHLHHDLHHPQVQEICDDKVIEHLTEVVDKYHKSFKSP